ncbi:MAG: ABC transporter substrate-binding protein [Tepidiforma sp.]|nr:ABC transporter substrate-binding protein [Tepidiforma sp.]GIW19010.1 MAG: ABC transporter substrate-binding protein [Tepidiforma sp.]
MRLARALGGAAAAALILFAGAACGSERQTAPPRPTPTPTLEGARPAGERTVTDMAGREVHLPARIERVVVTAPAAADYARALGLQVIGQPSDIPAAEGARPVGSTLNPDFPAIAALAPDLVIGDAAVQGARIPDFDRFTVPVYLVKAADYLAILDAVERLGEAVGRQEEAAALRADLEGRVVAAALAARERRAAQGGLRVLVLTGAGRDVFAAGPATYIGNLLSMLGAENALANPPEGGPLPGFGVIDPGAAALLAPDVVLVLPAGDGGLDTLIRTDPAWAAAPAVRSGRVYAIDRMLFLRAPGPRVAEAIETLLGLLWPAR